jgi:GlpG protein
MSRELPKRYSAAFRVFFPTGRLEVGWLTLALLVACLAVTILTSFGTDQTLVNYFSITRYRYVDGIHFGGHSGLPEICHGEIWRLFTPIFIHFAFSHLFYNALWILIFGTLIEKRQGIWVLALLVLGVAGLSDLAQYAVRGPAFGGISGVMCGLLGYIWTRDMLDPAAGLRLDRMVLILAILSAVASSFGVFGHHGQIVHAAGLFVGLVAGTVSGLWVKRSSQGKG